MPRPVMPSAPCAPLCTYNILGNQYGRGKLPELAPPRINIGPKFFKGSVRGITECHSPPLTWDTVSGRVLRHKQKQWAKAGSVLEIDLASGSEAVARSAVCRPAAPRCREAHRSRHPSILDQPLHSAGHQPAPRSPCTRTCVAAHKLLRYGRRPPKSLSRMPWTTYCEIVMPQTATERESRGCERG